jgi:hypothetical protein
VGRAQSQSPVARPFRWISQPMAARIDLADKEAVWAALDSED